MQYGYLIKISNNNIYKEVQLPVDAGSLKIGLGLDCDVRFHKDLFFENFELLFTSGSLYSAFFVSSLDGLNKSTFV